jgi:hypothetical protein
VAGGAGGAVSVGDAVRLSRRDRAAMTLALEVLRGGVDCSAHERFCDAMVALRLGVFPGPAYDIEEAANCGPVDEQRLSNARLALLLRAILRADAVASWDAWGSVPDPRMHCVCTGCGQDASGYKNGDRMVEADVCPVSGKNESARWPVPLWASAPTRAR